MPNFLLLSFDSALDYRDIRSILMASAQPSLTAGIAENSGIVDAAALRAAAEYEKPYEPAYLENFSIVKASGNLVPALYWSVDGLAAMPACGFTGIIFCSRTILTLWRRCFTIPRREAAGHIATRFARWMPRARRATGSCSF